MRHSIWRMIGLIALISCMAFAFGCAQYGGAESGAGSGYSDPSSEASPATGLNQISAGAQEDTLEACLARIPSNATAGQRMVAERTCKRDHETRKSILAVPN